MHVTSRSEAVLDPRIFPPWIVRDGYARRNRNLPRREDERTSTHRCGRPPRRARGWGGPVWECVRGPAIVPAIVYTDGVEAGTPIRGPTPMIPTHAEITDADREALTRRPAGRR